MLRGAGWLALAFSLFSSSQLAEAHQAAHPKVIAIHVNASGLNVQIHYELSPGDEPRILRKFFDADKDGQINGEEAEHLLDQLVSDCGSFSLRLDDQRLTLETQERLGDQVEGQVDRASSMSLDLSLRWSGKLPSGLHALEATDRSRLGQVPLGVWLDGKTLLLVTASQTPLDFLSKSVGPAYVGGPDRFTVIFLVQ